MGSVARGGHRENAFDVRLVLSDVGLDFFEILVNSVETSVDLIQDSVLHRRSSEDKGGSAGPIGIVVGGSHRPRRSRDGRHRRGCVRLLTLDRCLSLSLRFGFAL